MILEWIALIIFNSRVQKSLIYKTHYLKIKTTVMKQCLLVVMAAAIFQYTSGQSWNTTGNSGLITSNFLGTTDAKDVIFKAIMQSGED